MTLHLTEEPCVEWSGARNDRGYGQRWVKPVGAPRSAGRVKYVHRLAWEEVHGPIPDGLFVLHRCDNPPCYNVDHLFLGTHTDNMRDMVSKGRHARRSGRRWGSANGSSRLTEAQIPEIRALLEEGHSQRSVAKTYGVGYTTIRNIALGRTWAHVASCV